ncbi:putative inorganic carbon transporter subunit DabA [Microcella pacifica]|uniref:Probable inorganic carbon transporter subunit DabA n=1 Tax=Microcella pacifica TaxID=2591847 RepID=A0A9E5JNB7_9MICO|nr:putative inorganic carbon transporter subunit DabA [Microcella pacifica]NHF62076.1 DUF2309 family protein [Microcella pacifica]
MTDIIAPTRSALRARARAEIAASVIAPYYGLDAAIAVNPLVPSLSAGFAGAIAQAAPALGARGALSEGQYRDLLDSGRIAEADLARAIRRRRADSPQGATDRQLVTRFLTRAAPPPPRDRQPLSALDDRLARWCRAALAPEAAAWPVPVAELGFFGAWRALALHDATLPREARRRIAALPDVADRALATVLDRTGVSEEEQLAYFRAGLARLPGWAAYVRWRAMTSGDVDIVDVLAVRAALEWALDEPPATPNEGHSDDESAARALVWQEALESAPHRRVLEQIGAHTGGERDGSAPRAHLVFCIDPRSEGLRRHLERRGPYATSGFAGFFGIAALMEPLAATEPAAACPVLLTPRYRVAERPAPGAWREAARFVRALAVRRALRSSAKAPDDLPGAPLGWAEVTGWLLGPRSVARSLLAGRAVRTGRPDDPAMSVPTLLDLDSALTPEAQLDTAEVILRTMGMVESFAPLVVFVGHGTSTTNNAFRTALDCGACGGHRGAPNARAAAALLNTPAVRVGLRERGVSIPEATVFLAGEHDTATDVVALADLHRLDPGQREAAAAVERDACSAGRDLAAERVRDLPGASPRTPASIAVARRSRDWAQVYPEWGLARNAAIVIGPRSLTEGADLERRVFLHSYAPEHDPEGTALETILTAPLVVAHWINAQYYYSAVDPDVFGAGSKTVHNLVAGAGVLSGPSGDLRLGLPWQSVGTREGLHHEPVRLLVVVDAPRERIERIVERADVVHDLVHGEWVTLVRPGDTAGEWERCTSVGWEPWHLPGAEENQGEEAA